MACETMQEQGRQYQESNAALQAKLDNAIDTAFDLEAENAQLRKVADAARALVPIEMYQYIRHLFDLKRILDEYDKAKEGQDGKSI